MSDPRPATGPPVTEPSPLSAPYWEAARHGRLEIQRCRQCRRWNHLPQSRCPACLSRSLRFEEVSGRGTVCTFTVVHRNFVPGFDGRPPIPVGWVDLVEQPGLRVFADFVGVRPEDVRIGLPVVVTFTERPGWGTVPSFRPAT